MEMTEEMMQYVSRTNNFHQEIISCLEKQEDYILWLVLGAKTSACNLQRKGIAA